MNEKTYIRPAYTPALLSEATGINVRRIRQALRDKDLIGAKLGRSWIITAKELDQWLDRHSNTATTPSAGSTVKPVPYGRMKRAGTAFASEFRANQKRKRVLH